MGCVTGALLENHFLISHKHIERKDTKNFHIGLKNGEFSGILEKNRYKLRPMNEERI